MKFLFLDAKEMKQNWPIPKIKHGTFRLCDQLLPHLRVKVVRLHLDVYDFFNKAEKYKSK
jgi:hypothetical protein